MFGGRYMQMLAIMTLILLAVAAGSFFYFVVSDDEIKREAFILDKWTVSSVESSAPSHIGSGSAVPHVAYNVVFQFTDNYDEITLETDLQTYALPMDTHGLLVYRKGQFRKFLVR